MRPRLLVSCFASCGASLVAAQTEPTAQPSEPAAPLPAIFAPHAAPPSPPPPAGATRPAEAAPTPAPSSPPLRRAISTELSAKISALAIREAAARATTAAANTPATGRTGDSSDAVLLKPYVVKEDKLPSMKEREILTAKGQAALARSRYPGLGFLNDAAAVLWMGDQFEKERRQELKDLRGLLDGNKVPPELNQQINDMLTKPYDPRPGYNPPSRLPH